jgi:hypothetical protein
MSDKPAEPDDDYGRTRDRKRLVARILCAIIVIPLLVAIVAGVIHIAPDIGHELFGR